MKAYYAGSSLASSGQLCRSIFPIGIGWLRELFDSALALALAAQLAEPPPSAIVAGRVVDATSGRPDRRRRSSPPAGSAVGAGGSPSALRASSRTPTAISCCAAREGLARPHRDEGGYVNATYGQRRPGGSSQPIPVARRTADERRRAAHVEVRRDHPARSPTRPATPSSARASRRCRRRSSPAGAVSRAGPVAVTDDRGAYRIAGLTPGEYVVVVPSTQTSVPTDVMESFFTGTPISDAKRAGLAREMNAIGSAIAPAGSHHSR